MANYRVHGRIEYRVVIEYEDERIARVDDVLEIPDEIVGEVEFLDYVTDHYQEGIGIDYNEEIVNVDTSTLTITPLDEEEDEEFQKLQEERRMRMLGQPTLFGGADG